MARKTIDIEILKQMVNIFLLHSADAESGDRQGQMILIESVLKDTKNYDGFRYLTEKQMEESNAGNSFGIGSEESGSWDFNDTDPTRIQYF